MLKATFSIKCPFSLIQMLKRFRWHSESLVFSGIFPTQCHMTPGVQDNIRFCFNGLVILSDPLLGRIYELHSSHSATPPPTQPSLICIVNESEHLELASSQA